LICALYGLVTRESHLRQTSSDYFPIYVSETLARFAVRGRMVLWQATKRPGELASTLRLASHMFPVLRMILEKP
jgi:hypothetical protein